MQELSPMMKQYLDIKNQHKNSILFFRLGDFYEMFYDDAKIVSEELDITLTGKNCGKDERAPMCGVPYHSCESYIARLIAKGYKVAMCDQVGDPALAKGIVKREVTRVITPGTVIEESMLDEGKNNYISSIFIGDNSAGISFCDVSTGELKFTEISGNNSEDFFKKLKNELLKFSPKEILIDGMFEILEPLKNFIKEKLCTNIELCTELSQNNFYNFENKPLGTKSLNILFEYLQKTQKSAIERINSPKFYTNDEFMGLDANTVRNLELSETMRTKQKKGSLLWVIDKTKTAMGKRLLHSWVKRPLTDVSKILMRQEAVEEFFGNIILRDTVADALSHIQDIERIMTRISCGSAGARDLRSLCAAISNFPIIKNALKNCESAVLKKIFSNIDLLEDIRELINAAIVEEPPFSVREGGMIQTGYNEEVDDLRKNMDGGKNVIIEIETREREKTGISKLKVGFNKIFGYYIEVSNSFKNMVPESYIRKQTLTGGERYITQELKELETKILYSKDKIQVLEFEIFEKIRLKVAENLGRITKTANNIALLDVIRCFAEVAAKNNYTKPEINNSDEIIIEEGRHPVVELLSNNSPFVPNNVFLDNDENMISIITGPNMAGKSTYMRQTSLIVLMAQMGSFVPAKSAKIGIVDNIFTRIGASDDLASGQSTFMVEMNEVAEIIKNCTKNSILILDEIGRGTSTFDGMSIAKAILEYIANPSKCGSKTLFATHYHELTSMSEEFSCIKNYNIAVKRNGEDIVFLRRIVPGAADDSYGIEVAKLAGVPKWITARAKEILTELESGTAITDKPLKTSKKLEVSNLTQNENEILERLKNIDATVLSPIEAMNLIFELCEQAKGN